MKSWLFKFLMLAFLAIGNHAFAQSAFSLLRTNTPEKSQHGTNEEIYQRVKIWLDGKPASRLGEFGVDLSEGHSRQGVWFVSDLPKATVRKVSEAGFRTEIKIEDVSAFYRNRSLSTARRVEPVPTQSSACGSGAPQYPIPAHFYHGSMGGFFTYNQLLDILDSMALLFPNLITVKQPIDATQSIEGRDIYYVKISDNPNTDETEPEVLYTALHHAREPESLSQLIYYMWYLLENYGTDSEIQALVDNTEMYFVPCLNPDGYVFNELIEPNGGGMWRKNRRDNLDGEFGVDLNRNYGFNWGFDDFGSSPNTDSETYRGTSAFSEPETQAISNFCNSRQFRFTLNYHTYGNHLIVPWGYIEVFLTPDSDYFEFSGKTIARYNQYHVGTGYQTVGYTVNGGSDDWMYGEQSSKPKIFSMTPEVGDQNDGFWPDPSRINYLSESNMYANLTMAKLAGRYGVITHDMPRYASELVNQFQFTFRELGLDTTGTFTVSLTPLSANINATGNPVVLSGLSVMQTVNDSISFTLSPFIAPGDLVQYLVTLDNGWYTETDTVTHIFGNPVIALNDNGTNLANWTTTGNWASTTEAYVSAPSSITDSPFSLYQSNDFNTLRLSVPVSLAGAIDAQLTFSARWELEAGYDYMQISASGDNGASWTPLCGKYTVVGSPSQLPGEPLYDSYQTDWVKEQMSLNDFLGQSILIRFRLVSDNWTEFDGFYFDDLQVVYINALGTNVSPLQSEGLYLSPAAPNPTSQTSAVNYANVPSRTVFTLLDSFGREVWRTGLEDTNGTVNIPARNLASGIYSYRLVCADGSGSKAMKLIVH